MDKIPQEELQAGLEAAAAPQDDLVFALRPKEWEVFLHIIWAQADSGGVFRGFDPRKRRPGDDEALAALFDAGLLHAYRTSDDIEVALTDKGWSLVEQVIRFRSLVHAGFYGFVPVLTGWRDE